jgi:hypothetical protein
MRTLRRVRIVSQKARAASAGGWEGLRGGRGTKRGSAIGAERTPAGGLLKGVRLGTTVP